MSRRVFVGLWMNDAGGAAAPSSSAGLKECEGVVRIILVSSQNYNPSASEECNMNSHSSHKCMLPTLTFKLFSKFIKFVITIFPIMILVQVCDELK